MSSTDQRSSDGSSSKGKRRGGGGGGGRGGGRGGHRGGRAGGDKRDKGGGRGANKENEGRKRLESEMSDGGGDHCTVCLYRITIYSIGECNHPICHACSTRMRVLCQRNECAICRRDLPKVILTSTDRKYEDIKDEILPMDRKFKICFESEEIEKEYNRLLDNACTRCEERPSFRTFRQLDNHMRSEHQLYCCDLCVKNLKIFSHERKFYDKTGLMEHRRVGDKDDTSFKGHPLCEFCDQRFIDKEDLFKHLRKDHYFCHFCDADGNQFFYSEYTDLRRHFQKDHYLCEEPECEEEKFVVFRTEIDIKAHRLERHSSSLSKAASKQNRRVEIDFSFNRREGREERNQGRRDGGREERRRRPSPEYFDQLDGPPRPHSEAVPDLVADFPSLGISAPSAPVTTKSGELAKKLAQSSGHNTGASQSWAGKGGAAPSKEEDFPSLPGAQQQAPRPMSSYKPKPQPAGSKTKSKPQLAADEFPGLGMPSRPTTSGSKPAAKPVPSTNSRPSTAPSKPAAPTRSTANSQPSRRPGPFDSDEDDFPTLDGPSRPLNNASEKAVRASGQGMDYRRTDPTGNINIIDKSVIEALKDSKTRDNMSLLKPRDVNSIAEFPGLGPPETAFTKAPSKKKNKKNKGEKKEDKQQFPSSNSNTSQSSLSSIADMLGTGSDKPSKPTCDIKPDPVTVMDIKPVSSKFEMVEQLNRPSKQKPVQANAKKNKSTPVPPSSEEFPSLGNSSKKIGANFVRAEDKLIKNPLPPSQWAKQPALEAETVIKSANSPSKPQPALNKSKPRYSREMFVFHPPTEFQERNVKLISTVSDSLGGKSVEFKKFRETSGKFRNGDIKSDEYFAACSRIMEKKVFTSVFPELLALLPDIEKQEELLVLYRDRFPRETSSSLVQCSTCRQVLVPEDLPLHSTSHNLDEDFPVLG